MNSIDVMSRNIKNKKIELKKDYSELAHLLNLSLPSIRSICNKEANPTLNTIESIAKGLNVSVVWLLTDHSNDNVEDAMTLEEFQAARKIDLQDQTHKMERFIYTYEKLGNKDILKINSIEVPNICIGNIDLKDMTVEMIAPLDEIIIKKQEEI